MKLLQSLQELSLGSQQVDLKNSDATDAGASDVSNKASASGDIKFSLMRNTINSDGKVSGSDVTNYLERAAELNDEVDTVPFGLETDDGQIVKVYVNAAEADKFAEALKNLLGIEDDIEEAINRLSTQFDIVDVVWPTASQASDLTDTDSETDKYLAVDDKSMAEDEEHEEHEESTPTADQSGDEAPDEAANSAELSVPEAAKIADEDIRDFINTQTVAKITGFTRDGNSIKLELPNGTVLSEEDLSKLQSAFEEYLTSKGLFQESKFSILKSIDSPVSEISEELKMGDDYGHAVVSLALALGIPESILSSRQALLTQSLRTAKQTLKNKTQVLTAINRVMMVLAQQAPKEAQPTEPAQQQGIKTTVPGV